MKIIGESKDGVIIDYTIGSTTIRDRHFIGYLSDMSLMNLNIKYKANASTNYSTAIIAYGYNVKMENMDININGNYWLWSNS